MQARRKSAWLDVEFPRVGVIARLSGGSAGRSVGLVAGGPAVAHLGDRMTGAGPVAAALTGPRRRPTPRQRFSTFGRLEAAARSSRRRFAVARRVLGRTGTPPRLFVVPLGCRPASRLPVVAHVGSRAPAGWQLVAHVCRAAPRTFCGRAVHVRPNVPRTRRRRAVGRGAALGGAGPGSGPRTLPRGPAGLRGGATGTLARALLAGSRLLDGVRGVAGQGGGKHGADAVAECCPLRGGVVGGLALRGSAQHPEVPADHSDQQHGRRREQHQRESLDQGIAAVDDDGLEAREPAATQQPVRTGHAHEQDQRGWTTVVNTADCCTMSTAAIQPIA